MPSATYHKRSILNLDADLRTQQLARSLIARSTTTEDLPADTEDGSDSMINLLLLVLGLVFFSIILISGLLLIRRNRIQNRMRAEVLPSYHASTHHMRGGPNNPNGLTIETSHNGRASMIFISRDEKPMLSNPNSPPHSPDNVPQIHITFPDEHDNEGRPQSGRVLVVRVGDNATVGLEPMRDEQLPAYEKESKDGGFCSLDIDQLGGLKEKDRSVYQ